MRFLLLRFMLLVSLLLPAVSMAFGFPELPFCPLGGPPGWFNRMTGQHHRSYPPPPPPYFLAPRALPNGFVNRPAPAPLYYPGNRLQLRPGR